MTTRILIMCFLIIDICACSHKTMELSKSPKLGGTVKKEADFTRVKIDSVGIEMVFFNRLNEYPSPEDTLYRDYVDIGHIVPIDSLIGLKQTDYTGSFDYGDICLVKCGTLRFIIVSFTDAFIYGTDQEVNFIVFKEDENKIISVVSGYTNENNKPTDDIEVIQKGNYIELKGRYLKKIKGGSHVSGYVVR